MGEVTISVAGVEVHRDANGLVHGTDDEGQGGSQAADAMHVDTMGQV
jgi:hypothetical protein